MNIKKWVSWVMIIVLILAMTGCGAGMESEKAGKTVAVETAEATEPAVVETESEEMSVPDLAEYVQKRTVTINVTFEDGNGTGSGFFIDDNGTVVTSYHVIDGAQDISVEVADGGKYDVKKIIDFSHVYDIAVLKIDVEGNDYLKIRTDKARTGETVYAVGSSLGFLNGTFSNGIVSTSSRSLGLIDCIQTTAAISSGNSGGPLVNAKGEVIGINSFSYESGENLNLSINIDMLEDLEQDRNWNISQFREWYKKELSRSYRVWNYTTEEWSSSKINTYQHVTGRACELSSLNWDFTEGDYDDLLTGYHDDQGIYLYEYHVDEFDKYTEYLYSIGFTFTESKDFTQGTSYYYENEFDGFKMDIFVMDGEGIIAVEAYSN